MDTGGASTSTSEAAPSPTATPPPTTRPRRSSSAAQRPSRCFSIEALYGPEEPPIPPSTPHEQYPGMTGLATIMSVAEPEEMSTDYQSFPPAPSPGLASPQSPGLSPPATPFQSRARSRSRSHSVTVNMPPRRQYTRMRDRDRDIEAEAGAGAGAGAGARSPGRARSASDARRSVSVRMSNDSNEHDAQHDDDGSLNDEVVGLLDCVDTEVGTVNHLQNMTNGIMFPNIPSLWSRRTHVTLPSHSDESEESLTMPDSGREEHVEQPKRPRAGTLSRVFGRGGHDAITPPQPLLPKPPKQPEEAHIMVDIVHDKLDAELDSETDEIVKEHDLDRHLKRLLKKQKRKQKIKAGLRGLWTYLKTPMGAVTAIYGFLVAFWGAAIVLFLLGWIPTSSKDTQDKWVEISSQVTNGLFTVTGVGLIPWRVIDTYRISVIWQYRKKIEKRRKKQGLEPIENYDDLPDPDHIPGYVNVLSSEEQKRLRYNQEKFSESQTWYKAHATATHTAFPMGFALWNTILMDGNSFFQCLLCGTMWGMNRHKRPAWTTGTLIPLSFLCGIGAAVLIWQGGVRSKKTKAVEEKLRKALGVDEKVRPEVKKPRRATVGGAPPPRLDVPHRPRRSASINVASDPAVVESFNREHGDHGLTATSLQRDRLGVVAESGDEDEDSYEGKEARPSPRDVVPSLPQETQRERQHSL